MTYYKLSIGYNMGKYVHKKYFYFKSDSRAFLHWLIRVVEQRKQFVQHTEVRIVNSFKSND